jgi:single-strand DNA-binding protein
MNVNCVVMIGRLVKDVEYKETSGGLQIGIFTIAVNDYKNKEKITYFFDCKIFGKYAEILVKYKKKGELIGIIGKLVTEKWQDKETIVRSRTIIYVQEVDISLGKREEKQESTPSLSIDESEKDIELSSNLPF